MMMDTVAEFDNINTRIAERVRTLRAERELSLDVLAARCNVSRSMISLIERGESSPTAVVLDKLAAGLGVPLASLFDAPAHAAVPQSLARRQNQSVWRDPESGYQRRNLSPAGYPSPIHIVEVEFPARARVAYESGARDVRMHEQIWMIAGTLELTIGDQPPQRLHSGDCLALELDQPVVFRNPNRSPAHYIVVIVSETAGGQRRSRSE
jgi:transcriptional regulator with XRE-family HTH domain